MPFKTVAKFSRCSIARGVSGHDDKIECRQLHVPVAKGFTYLALDQIPGNGPWRNLARNGHAQASLSGRRAGLGAWRRQHGEELIGGAVTFAKDAGERFRSQQPRVAWKPEIFSIVATLHLRTELRPTLGAARIDDLATTLGRHTGTESVGARAAQIARLKRSFHDCES